MNWNLPQLLVEQAPLFWMCVASFFFLLGILWANACWASYRVRLMKAEEEQLFLVAEREQAFEAREKRLRQSGDEESASESESRSEAKILRFDKANPAVEQTLDAQQRT